MKTSNKLLIGLFVLVLVGMIIYNFALTKEIKSGQIHNNQTNIQHQDSLLIDVDSAAINYPGNPLK
ncbi:MAG: hypothetical protein WCG93_02265 [Paludibacter sp.]